MQQRLNGQRYGSSVDSRRRLTNFKMLVSHQCQHDLETVCLNYCQMLNQVFKVFSGTYEQFVEDAASELSMGWVNPRVGLGRYFLIFGWLGWVGSWVRNGRNKKITNLHMR